ncbi:MAG TPA: hypothetical protein EYQ00_02055, partial [Dehalococcoidia bacterium]|nr:hypothetical protein [Dehalococcoidia bacterium]
MTHSDLFYRLYSMEKLVLFRILPCILGLFIAVCAPIASAQQPEFTPDQIRFFQDDIYPILSSICFECHAGGDKLEGDLYLTSRESMLKGGENGPVFEMDDLADT